MTRVEKLQIINNAVKYYKNSTDPNDSIKKVSKQFGIGQETLSKYLKEKKISIRPQAHNSSKSNKLETISDELKSKQGNMSKSQFKQYLIDLAI
jgi:phage antirepressor YoqD-like protein